MRWVEIAINSNRDTEDTISNILIEQGCSGTASFVALRSADERRVCGYLPVDDRLEARLQSIKDRINSLTHFGIDLPDTQLSITWVEDEEWANAWRKYFKPLKLDRIVIKPTWEDYIPNEDELIIELDPGMAFGTGNHESTQLCVRTLQSYVKDGHTLIDAGCGSGILALTAAKLGASRVFAFDNDPIAVTAATANVKNSGLSDVIAVQLAQSPLACQYEADVVVANIIPDVIINLSDDLLAKTKPGGVLIVSGIVDNRVDDVRKVIESKKALLLEDRRQNDWSALVFEKKA